MKTVWYLNEILTSDPEPVRISGSIHLEEALINKTKRIISTEKSLCEGYFFYSPEKGEYQLSVSASTQLVLPSTRSLKPVPYHQDIQVNESYLPRQHVENHDDLSYVILLDEDYIDIADVLVENIILSLPSQVLTEEEKAGEALPSGEGWEVMTEDEHEDSRLAFKQENSPFSQLKGLFEDSKDS